MVTTLQAGVLAISIFSLVANYWSWKKYRDWIGLFFSVMSACFILYTLYVWLGGNDVLLEPDHSNKVAMAQGG